MIVKIQNRRGGYTDYDPSKLLPGEFAVVQVGDPNTPTGKGVYLAITAGDVVRLATTEEIAAYTQQFDDIYQSTLQDAGVILDEAKLLISNYTGNLIVVNSISDMTDTSNLYLYNGSGEYKNYVYVYDPEQSAFVPLINYGMFADLSGQISQNTSNIATNTANIATNTASIATNTTNIATNASNIAENAVNIAGLAVGVTNKVVKTTLSTTQIYANETVSAYNSLSIPGLSDYMVVMVFAVCGNTRQRLVFVNGDAGQQYMYTTEGNNKIRAGCYVDWEGGRVRIRYLSAEGAYTYQNVYFTNVVGFVKQGAIDGSGSSDFTPYQALYDAIIAYIDEHYTPTDSVPNEVKQAIYTLLNKAAYTETGLTDELAVVESWTATTFNITNRLTNCASNNSATVVNSRTQYTATLTANTGYVLNTVTVTMGGDDITSTAYSSGTITIPSVTGNIVITAVAVQAVASLSAVYTQSGTVYDTDALNTLKSDLVVTATYSDSSTATIPSANYTLSGTLSTGTSTITVSYGGKTTTFTVSVTHGDNSLYSWDFKSGLTDSKQGVVATTTATQTNGTGLIYNAINQHTLITGISSILGKTVEIDVEEIGTRVGGNHRRLFLFYGTNASQQAGFICNAGSSWKYYSGSAWDSSSIEDADASYFNGKTVKIDISETGAITVSRKDIGAADSTYEQVYTSSIGAISSVTADATHCEIGLNNGSDGLGNATISAMRIYEGV